MTSRRVVVWSWALVLAATLLPTGARGLLVRGDSHWRGIDDCPQQWSAADLDDSTWSPVAYPWIYLWPQEHPDLPKALPFWTTAEHGESCARRHFTLDAAPHGEALVKIWVDDDYDLYINGDRVGASHDHATAQPGETYDVSALLRAGDNVVAIRLIDYGGDGRGALFTLLVPDAADEPRTLADTLGPIIPWVVGIGLVLAFAAALVGATCLARKAAPYIQRLPAQIIALLTIALVFLCQWYLQSTSFYSIAAHPGAPFLGEWDWPLMSGGFLLLTLLVVFSRSADGESLEAAPPLRHEWAAVLAILLLALFLRTTAFDHAPLGFFQDEAINGTDALHLLDARSWEIWSDSIGGRPTLFLYLLGAVLHVAGRTYLALKILPVSFGVASVLALYVLGRVAIGPRPALYAAFLLAISWWHIAFSRLVFEVNCVPFFAATGFALLLHALGPSRRSFWALVAAGVVLTTGLYTYAAYRAVPAAAIVFLALTALYRDRDVLRERALGLIAAAVVSAVVLVPLIHFAWQNPLLYWSRYADVSLTKYMGYYGTPVPWLHQFGKALLSLNQQGDRHVEAAYLDAVTAALFLLGLTVRVREEQRMGWRLQWAWFLTFMALSSLTRDSPHLTRSLGALPPILLFAGVGADRLFAYLRSAAGRFAAPLCVVVLGLAATLLNAHQYFVKFQNQPDADNRMNVRARTLCETFQHALPADLYMTYDLDYWCVQQCHFLVPLELGKRIVFQTPEELLRGMPTAPRPGRKTLVAVGGEFIDRYSPQLPMDDNFEIQLNLPVRPKLELDRAAHPTYYLYEF